MVNYLILQKFLIAIGIGALIGAERERVRGKRTNVGGFRTFIFVSILGGFTTFLMSITGLEWIFAVIFGAVAVLTIVTYIYMAQKEYLGVITEFLIFLTFILGFLALTDQFSSLAIISAVAIVIITEVGRLVHDFINKTSHREWTDTLRFVAVVFLIYPLLPDRAIDAWGLINLSEIWFMVVLISAIQFIGYYLVKTFGSKKGILVNGLMGGLVSSTATTSSMANASTQSKDLTNELVTGTLLSTLVKFGRVLVLIGIISMELLFDILPFILLPALVLALKSATLYYSNKKKEVKNVDIDLGLWSPFSFLPALKMALLFAGIKVLAKIALKYWGSSGMLITTAISGLIDVDAITLSIGDMFASGSITSILAIQSVLLAVIVNSFVKAGIAASQGSEEYGKEVVYGFGFTIIAGLVSMIAAMFIF